MLDMNDQRAELPLLLRVAEARLLNPLIRLVRFVPADGVALPAWSAGAHIQIEVTLAAGKKEWRDYSLIDFEQHVDSHLSRANEFTIAVRKEERGRGGSRFVHEQLNAGDVIRVQQPKNDFLLVPGSSSVILMAGGIGVTPLVSMAADCLAIGRDVQFYYAGRSRSVMAFVDELSALLGSRLHVHADDENRGAVMDVGSVMDGCAATDSVYVCGPKPMLDAALAASAARHWKPGRVHFELFTSPASSTSKDHAFEVELAQSGVHFTVPVDRTLLDCLLERGYDVLYDCKRGECGVCSVDVISGAVDHRDYVLSDTVKKSGRVMQICVSRARDSKIVLDL